ncbi:MAG: GH12 family glycosyl hydrolase domain-containing protein [Panacagrimonas sp.]
MTTAQDTQPFLFRDEGLVCLAAHGDRRGLALENNQWGRTRNGATGQQTVWYDNERGEFGWNWNWTGANGGRVTGYPEVVHGHKPWSHRETLGRIQQIGTLAVDYEFETVADGSWNATFEMWLTRGAKAHGNDITAEIMVWVARDAADALRPCGGEAIRSWPDRGLRLYQERSSQRAPIFSFVLDRPQHAGRVDLRWYLDVLLEWGRIPGGDHICAVEFGNEVVNGSGSTVVRRFDVTHIPTTS